MKRIAIFGGTGFIGYDFVRLVLETGAWCPVVYCTNPGSLANLRRHELDIRVVVPSRTGSVLLDDDVEAVVNFAHPFAPREGLSPAVQMRQFVRFLELNRARHPDLKLVHVSSLSVYEPFAERREYLESDRLRPPRSDTYAVAKVRVENSLRGLPGAEHWQLVLRPTIVYGPFCRPWTDALMRAFREGDVPYVDLSGRIQPVFGRDVSRVIAASLSRFRPGVLNLGGPQTMPWMDFFGFFQEIVGEGKLARVSGAEGGSHVEPAFAFYMRHMKALKRSILADQSFNAIAARLAQGLPRPLVSRVRDILRAGGATAIAASDPPPTRGATAYTRRFFAEDRLVSMRKFEREFPDFAFTPLPATRDQLRSYYEFRFTDRLFT